MTETAEGIKETPTALYTGLQDGMTREQKMIVVTSVKGQVTTAQQEMETRVNLLFDNEKDYMANDDEMQLLFGCFGKSLKLGKSEMYDRSEQGFPEHIEAVAGYGKSSEEQGYFFYNGWPADVEYVKSTEVNGVKDVEIKTVSWTKRTWGVFGGSSDSVSSTDLYVLLDKTKNAFCTEPAQKITFRPAGRKVRTILFAKLLIY